MIRNTSEVLYHTRANTGGPPRDRVGRWLNQAFDSEQAGDVAGAALDLIEPATFVLDAVELTNAR